MIFCESVLIVAVPCAGCVTAVMVRCSVEEFVTRSTSSFVSTLSRIGVSSLVVAVSLPLRGSSFTEVTVTVNSS